MSVQSKLIEDVVKFGERAGELVSHRSSLSKKLAEDFEKEGIESVNKRLPSIISDVHKEMKGQGYELASYTSDLHVGHEIEGMAAKAAPGYPGTRATWQHPETGMMSHFDLDNSRRPLGASNPSLVAPGSRVNKELYQQGEGLRKLSHSNNLASIDRNATEAARQHAEIRARKAAAESPTVAAANAPQAAINTPTQAQLDAASARHEANAAPGTYAGTPRPEAVPSPAAQPPVPAAEPAAAPGKGKNKGKNKGKGKGGGGKPAAPAAPSVAQGSPVSAAQAAPPAPPSAPPPPAGGQSRTDPAYQLAEHDRQMRKFRERQRERPGVRGGPGSSKKPAPKPSPSPADPDKFTSPLMQRKAAKKLRDAVDKSRSTRTRMSTYPPDPLKRPAQEARRYEKPTVTTPKKLEYNDRPGLKQKRHWGKGQKNLLGGLLIDAVGMPAIGGLLGGLQAGYNYDPEQDQNDRYASGPVIGRGNAMVQGAIEGAGYGAAVALGTGTMKVAGRLMGNGAFAHGGSVLGSFARGIKTGFKGTGTDSWTNTVGSSLAGESHIAADIMHKSSIAEVDRLVKESGESLGSTAVKRSGAGRRESFFGGMLSDAAKATPYSDDSEALQSWLSRAETNKPSKRPDFHVGQTDHSPIQPGYARRDRHRLPFSKYINSPGDSTASFTPTGVNTNVGTDVVGPHMTGGRKHEKMMGWNKAGAALSSIPNMLGNALGIAVGTVPMSIGKVDDWYGESVAPGANPLPWKRKWGKEPLQNWGSTHFGTTENPGFDAAKEASHSLNPFGDNKRTSWNGKQTATQIGAWGLVGGGIIANSGYSMLEDSAYSGPSSHPINAIFNRPDQGITARAQAEADAAEKIRMTDPGSMGLRDAEEHSYTNPNLRPVRQAHKPGQYNDSGDLVFALSALRRG